MRVFLKEMDMLPDETPQDGHQLSLSHILRSFVRHKYCSDYIETRSLFNGE